MKKQASYTITLGFSSSDQKLLTQLQRESKGALHSLEAVVYKFAAEGISAKLKALHGANVANFKARKNGKAIQPEEKPEAAVKAQSTIQSSATAE
jgi:hypothetical protein